MKILSFNVDGYKSTNWPQINIIDYIIAFFENSGDIAILHEVPYKNKSNSLQNAFSADKYKIEEPKALEHSSYCPNFITLGIFKKSSFSDKSYEIRKGNGWARWLEIEITLENKEKTNILGVHIPNALGYKRIEDKAYFCIDALLYSEKHKKENTIIVGDFNTFTEDDSTKGINSTLSECLNRLTDIGYADTWREKHANKNEYTWYNGDDDGRRLDYAFVSEYLKKNYNYGVQYDHSTNVAVSQKGLSDHSALILELNGLKTL